MTLHLSPCVCVTFWHLLVLGIGVGVKICSGVDQYFYIIVGDGVDRYVCGEVGCGVDGVG